MYKFCDYHTHSTNSIDGKNSIMELCRSAVEKGIEEIAVTDHFEPTSGDESCRSYKPNVYYTDILKAREKFKGRLSIKMGVELGHPHRFPDTSKLLIDSFPFDYVIGSAHKIPGDIDVSQIDYSSVTSDQACKNYLVQLKELANWGYFDCIGHIDLIKRYCTDYYKTRITLSSHYELLKDVLNTVVSKGKGIEINTSGLRQAPKETMPGIDVLKIYKEIGGEVLTIGSDAHSADDVGKGIVRGIEIAREAGFRFITVFDSRVPRWERISAKPDFFSFAQ